ncbi:MAG: hypothetical protein KBG20_04395 [Caldilineaceae bacterium]|nr:hypothetical protein [Caldilineaceae bacterium]MBP8106805.1 hypothetical protein [Caldilineaceae bacterium]MBP8121699.1 hypothetical protein [Caldilineaceae bacterium]MBP9071511.1 hypothetical protein [Caldilineaceae bacterium]
MLETVVGNQLQTQYTVSAEANDYVVRVSRDLVERDDLARIFDALMLHAIKRRSQLSEDEIDALAGEVKHGAWERVKHLFVAA